MTTRKIVAVMALALLGAVPAHAQTTDVVGGLANSVAYKLAVRVATTANITLSGLQTIDGVVLASGDRVLVKDQTTTSQNGIYTASTGAWSRASDFSNSRGIAKGTRVSVTDGTAGAGLTYAVSTTNPTIGSALAFTAVSSAIVSVTCGTNLTGGTITTTGTCALQASPALTGVPTAPTAAVDTNTTQLATTGFVIGQGYAKLANPTFTGSVTLPGAPTNSLHAATKSYVDTADALKAPIASPTFTGTVTLPGAPATSLEAATKAYVDAAASAGMFVHAPARVATTAALTATYNNGAGTLTNSGVQAAISLDSVSLSLNDRVLVKDQASSFQNGIYTVTTVGSGASNWVLTRATDFDAATAGEIATGAYVLITGGSTYANSAFMLSVTGAITVGTTGLPFVQYSGAVSGYAPAASPTFTGSTTISGMTNGSIPYFASSGVITQDNTNFFWDASSKRLGIGTNSPAGAIDVAGSSYLRGSAIVAPTDNAKGLQVFEAANNNYWLMRNNANTLTFSYNGTSALISSDTSGNVTANDLTVQKPSSYMTNRTLSARQGDRVSVFDCMSTSQIADVKARTLLIDVSAAVNTCAQNHTDLYFPEGAYLFSTDRLASTANSNVNWHGAGMNATNLVFSSSTANKAGLWIDNSTETVSYSVVVRDMSIYTTVDQSAGNICLNIARTRGNTGADSASGPVIENVLCSGGTVTGASTWTHYWANGIVCNCSMGVLRNVRAIGKNAGSTPSGISSNMSAGIWLKDSTDVLVDKWKITWADYGVYTSVTTPGGGTPLNVSEGIRVLNGTALATNYGVFFANQGANSPQYVVKNNNTDTYKMGVYVYSLNNFVISDNYIDKHSDSSSSTTFDGIYIDSTANYGTIMGNSILVTGTIGSSDTGINMSNTATLMNFSNNILYNLTYAFNANSNPATTNRWANNVLGASVGAEINGSWGGVSHSGTLQ